MSVKDAATAVATGVHTGRRMHLVGSLPGVDAQSAMESVLRRGGGRLRTLPDGETGRRSEWIADFLRGLSDHPDLRTVHAGDVSSYDRLPRYRVRSGHRLLGASMDLGVASAFSESYPVFRALRDRFALPDLRFQVGVAGDLDLAFFSLGPAEGLHHRRSFTEAVVRELRAVRSVAGDDVVFQLELPAESVLVSQMPGRAGRTGATWLARGVRALVQNLPAGSRFGVHLCLGDLGHRALVDPDDTAPLVTLANAIGRAWPDGRSLEYLHLPLAAGEQPPALAPSFYAPLRGIRLPESTSLVAGFVHEDLDTDDHARVLDLVERAVGRRVDVAAACGLGRRDPDAASRVVDQAAALCLPDTAAEMLSPRPVNQYVR